MKATVDTERRQSERKGVKSGIVALLQSDKSVEIGNVIDISHSGISFFIDTDACSIDIKNPVKMDILLINENIFLEHVSTSIISERIWQDDPQLNKHHTVFRFGVKFKQLESSQERHLKKLTAGARA
jgi:hypothetical protein